jgi:hypothetical protein
MNSRIKQRCIFLEEGTAVVASNTGLQGSKGEIIHGGRENGQLRPQVYLLGLWRGGRKVFFVKEMCQNGCKNGAKMPQKCPIFGKNRKTHCGSAPQKILHPTSHPQCRDSLKS